MTEFLKAITGRVLILGGAMGTLLQERGLSPGGCPEEMNRNAPDTVIGIHAEYAEAGADILIANSFGGNRVKLANYNLGNAVDELNRRAVALARKAAPAGVFVGGSVGPTGRFVEPVGDAGFDEMIDIFAEQISSLAGAGADLISFQSFLDIRELRAGVIACRDVCSLPVIAQMTFDDGGRTVLGTPPSAAAVTLDALRVDVIGANCGLGIDGIHDVLAEMRQVTPRPLIAQANVGLPTHRNGQTMFPATPEEMTAYNERLISLGVRVVSGCCGTTPRHIRVMRDAFNNYPQDWCPPPRRGFLSSRSGVAEFGVETRCALIGERINPTGKKGYTEELRAGKTTYIRREAAAQVAAGADLLDLNCGAPGVDEAAALERAVYAASGASPAPLVIDTSDPIALEKALKAADGKVLINSVSGEASSLARVLPLARRYGAALIGLTLDEDGIPGTAEGRVAVARRIHHAVLSAGLHEQDLVIDCLTLTVSAEQKRALETLRTLRLVRDQLGLATALGVSNISFGLPSRPVLSSVFFAMALEAGLKVAIINPMDKRIMDAYRSAMVILGHDLLAENYIADYADRAMPAQPVVG
ncbi:MAG: homocysteine S-methyltransferase family protein [Desulfuromonadales bacterium]|nr:homocysteine S-methyltransferase family protein [Desulfuromonadales bacterium]